jgi:hypothetical protein
MGKASCAVVLVVLLDQVHQLLLVLGFFGVMLLVLLLYLLLHLELRVVCWNLILEHLLGNLSSNHLELWLTLTFDLILGSLKLLGLHSGHKLLLVRAKLLLLLLNLSRLLHLKQLAIVDRLLRLLHLVVELLLLELLGVIAHQVH